MNTKCVRGKPVYLEEWVRVSGLRNKYFVNDGTCEFCNRVSCGAQWFSIRTKKCRCYKCFDAETEHWGRQQ